MDNYKAKKKKKRKTVGVMPNIKNNCGGRKRKKAGCAYDMLKLPYMQN